MKKSVCNVVLACVWTSLLSSGPVFANEWQNKLNETIPHLEQQPDLKDNQLSTSSLSQLLSGGDNAVKAENMNNAAGVMEFCIQQKIVKSDTDSVKKQALDKLGLSDKYGQAQEADYQKGISGLLDTNNGQSLDLKSLSNSSVGEKVQSKVCDVILRQSKHFISG